MSELFERRVARALRSDVSLDGELARRRVMERVRQAAAEGHPIGRGERWYRRQRHSIVGLTLAAGIGGLSTLSALVPAAQRDAGERLGAVVIGDTVVATLRDTLRLVRLMFDAPNAQRVEVAGDFNGWGSSPVALEQDERSRRWSVTLALRSGEHRYAFVVDDTRWTPDPRAGRTVQGDDGRLYSILSLSRAAN
jgi:Glycogen recognition site of AMP-activated protein kinase